MPALLLAQRGVGPAIEVGRSFKLGVIRLTERFVKRDPIAPRDERRLVRHITSEIGEYLGQFVKAGYDRVIGTSGTILSLGAVASAAEGKPHAGLRNRRIATKQVHRIRQAVTSVDLQKRLLTAAVYPRPVFGLGDFVREGLRRDPMRAGHAGAAAMWATMPDGEARLREKLRVDLMDLAALKAAVLEAAPTRVLGTEGAGVVA